MVVTYYFKLFRTGADRHIGILMSLLFWSQRQEGAIKKIWFGDGGYKKLLLNGRLIFKSGMEMFQKGGNDEKGVEKLATLSVANLKR